MYFYMIPMDNWKLNYKSKSLLGMGAHTYTPGTFEAKVGRWLTSSVLAWTTQLQTSLSYRIRLCLKTAAAVIKMKVIYYGIKIRNN